MAMYCGEKLPEGITIRSSKGIQIAFSYNGESYRETMKIPPTKSNIKHAKRKREAILHEIAFHKFCLENHFPNSKKLLNSGNSTVKELVIDFLNQKKPFIAITSYNKYTSTIHRECMSWLSDSKIGSITHDDIHKWLSSVILRSSTVNDYLSPYKSCFEWALHEGLIHDNPFKRMRKLSYYPNIKKGQDPKKKPDPFTPAECSNIKASLNGWERNYFEIGIYTGLRQCELRGLQWQDVDVNEKKLHVRRNVVSNILKGPKTEASRRTITLCDSAVQIFKEQAKLCSGDNIFVFGQSNSRYDWLNYEVFISIWKKKLERAGVRYRPPRQCRHTYASINLSAGENELFLSRQMGHEDVTMVRKIYGQFIAEVLPDAGVRANNIFNKI